jgi:death-on-curing protein
MSEPKWLSRTDVEALHTMAIDRDGGSHGLRDANLLESALARPQNLHAYGEDDRFQLAASYAEGIARNHAFVDGNKRTAFAAALMFLHDNGYDLLPRQDDGYVDMMVNLGQGKISREDAAAYLSHNARAQVREIAKMAEPPAKDWSAKPDQIRGTKPLPAKNKDRDR